MKQLSWTDALLYRAESRSTPVHMNAVVIYDPSTAPDGRVRFTGILRTIEERLHLAPTFRRRLVDVPLGLGAPYWAEDADFDLEYHVRHIALPKPGDWRQLQIQLARLHSRQLDMSRPPWEMTVIEGLDNIDGIPAGSFATSLKIHHSALDGIAGAEMLAALHDLDADGTRPRPETPWSGERIPSGARLLARAARAGLRRPIAAAKVVGVNAPGLAKRVATTVLPDSGDGATIPHTRFQGPVTPHRVVDCCSYDFDRVRAIRKAVDGATVNDVVIAHVGGALRRYLQHHGELPEDSLAAMCPVSIRTDGEHGSGGNRFTGARQSLRTDLADAGERLTAVTAEGRRQRESRAGTSASALLEIAELMPGMLLGAAVRTVVHHPSAGPTICNVVVSNVPGSPVPLYFAGARAVRMFGFGPIFGGIGLNHIVGTYDKRLDISFIACREQMPDPAFYSRCLDDAFAEMERAALTR